MRKGTKAADPILDVVDNLAAAMGRITELTAAVTASVRGMSRDLHALDLRLAAAGFSPARPAPAPSVPRTAPHARTERGPLRGGARVGGRASRRQGGRR